MVKRFGNCTGVMFVSGAGVEDLVETNFIVTICHNFPAGGLNIDIANIYYYDSV